MTKTTLAIGQIGAGRIGRLHAEHLRYRVPRADLRVLADVNEGAAQDCAQRFGIPETSVDYKTLLSRDDIEAGGGVLADEHARADHHGSRGGGQTHLL